MKNKDGSGRMLFLMISASFLVVAVIALISYFATRQSERTGITLPPASAVRPEDETIDMTGEGFVSVSPQNAATVVKTLRRPETYHQVLYKQIVSEDSTGIFSVHLWVNGDVCKLVLLESGQIRHILTNGSLVYIWYEDAADEIVSLELPSGISLDDLSGIPTYETIVELAPENIQDADYRQLAEQADAPCLYVRSSEPDGAAMSLWVDLSSGLLCKAEYIQDGKLRYSLHQSDLVVLDTSDAGVNQQLLLPDGSDPFVTAS